MTRWWQIHQRLVQVLPAEVLLTPDTFDQEIMLAQRLAVRAEYVGVLAQPSARLPGLAGSYHPQGIQLPQLSALRRPKQAAAAQRHTDPFFWCWRWSSSEALASAPRWGGRGPGRVLVRRRVGVRCGQARLRRVRVVVQQDDRRLHITPVVG